MLASVIVPARNAESTLPRTLAALAAQRLDGEFEVIVVDDGSGDATGRIARDFGATVVRHDEPVGPGASRNAGVAAAKGTALVFTDADCFPTPGWLAAGVRALRSAGLVQGRVEPVPGTPVRPFDKTLWVTESWGLFESANLFVRRDVFERLGGFGDGLLELAGAHFGEDAIFGWQARRAGVPVGFCDEALVHHEVFSRGPAGFIRERRRVAYFAYLASQLPELRETLFYRRFFLTRRNAAFALAATAVLAAACTRRPSLALPATIPYGRLLADDVREFGGVEGLRVALVRAGADSVGLAALLRASIAARTLVI